MNRPPGELSPPKAEQAIGAHLGARAPGNVDLLGQGVGGIVVRDHAEGGRVGAGEGDAVVDVEDAIGAARREDVAGSRDLVRLGVHLAVRPEATAGDGRLCRGGGGRVLAEVVGAVEGAGHTLLELGVAVVCALENGELEAAGVLFEGKDCCQHIAPLASIFSLMKR